eukprot:230411-Prorocentrum_lima.AAC.1
MGWLYSASGQVGSDVYLSYEDDIGILAGILPTERHGAISSVTCHRLLTLTSLASTRFSTECLRCERLVSGP